MAKYFRNINTVKIDFEYKTPIGTIIFDEIKEDNLIIYLPELKFHEEFITLDGVNKYITKCKSLDKSQICMKHREVKCCKECCQYPYCKDKSELVFVEVEEKPLIKRLNKSEIAYIQENYSHEHKKFNTYALARKFGVTSATICKYIKKVKK